MKGKFQTLINSDTLVLIDFFADWCGPCKTLSPILQEVSHELKSSVKVVKINVDKNKDLSQKYQIRGVPTMMLFKKGKMLWQKSGVLPKNEIISQIKKFL